MSRVRVHSTVGLHFLICYHLPLFSRSSSFCPTLQNSGIPGRGQRYHTDLQLGRRYPPANIPLGETGQCSQVAPNCHTRCSLCWLSSYFPSGSLGCPLSELPEVAWLIWATVTICMVPLFEWRFLKPTMHCATSRSHLNFHGFLVQKHVPHWKTRIGLNGRKSGC